ncbi:hypothetical protein [Rhodococcoides yunnanense]|uniref:hypothetical protein n=1 Tax=Rhodococcoides yunnanense TaxID=278209 RepID=UPI0022B18F98|nr:hypothetical protein [Rhodococcus yunnanensis]MCZ4275089.1 hypothetical protein [Rhodococcus yunnanensis]
MSSFRSLRVVCVCQAECSVHVVESLDAPRERCFWGIAVDPTAGKLRLPGLQLERVGFDACKRVGPTVRDHKVGVAGRVGQGPVRLLRIVLYLSSLLIRRPRFKAVVRRSRAAIHGTATAWWWWWWWWW